jgi:N-methylhydantoinase B/oxoprolinase/acetone carboxylase alpha subunit
VNQWGVSSVGGGGGWARNTMGQGARIDSDGMDSSLFRSAVFATGSDGEEAEVDQPTLHLWQKHDKDSGGNGKNRGGVSGYISTIFYAVPSADRPESNPGSRMRSMIVGNGLFGGYPSISGPAAGIENSNILELMAKGEKNIPTSFRELIQDKVLEGDYLLPSVRKHRPARVAYAGSVSGFGTPGGQGYGDVLERDPQAIVDDIRAEIISEWTAANVYHVVYDAATWTADLPKTAELRKKEREARFNRGINFDEFEKEWSKQKPPEDQLVIYGSWPDANVTRRIIRL